MLVLHVASTRIILLIVTASAGLEAPSSGQLYLLLSRLRDCSLKLGRVAEGTPQAVSPWSAFNASFFQNIPAHQSQRSYICKTFRADTMLLLLMFHSAALSATCQSSFFSDEVGDCARAMIWSCAVATALNQEHVIITVDQTRQSTAKHKKFVGSIHASFKMSCSGWVPSTQLPPS